MAFHEVQSEAKSELEHEAMAWYTTAFLPQLFGPARFKRHLRQIDPALAKEFSRLRKIARSHNGIS